MTQKSNRRIWENAVPLSEAWISFAAVVDRATLAATPNFLAKLAEDTKPSATLGGLLGAGFAAVTSQQRRIDTQTKMKSDLLDALFNGDLAALAFRETPTRSSSPAHIDPDFFDDPAIGWENDTAEAFGTRYNRIRIYNPATLPANAKPRIGRPSSAERVVAAIRELKDANPDFCEWPRKKAFVEIRNYIGVKNVSGSGLSDQNLGKYILGICGGRRITK